MHFEDKVVIVTGASSGIGAAIAKAFAEHGAKLCLVGRNKTKLDKVAEHCKTNEKPLIVTADVSVDADAKKVIISTIKAFGKLDILVNNAGIVDPASILADNALETFDKVMNTNLRAAVQLINLAAPYLIKTKGNIINTSSIASTAVMMAGNFSYCVSKAGLDHFTRSVALELAPKGVRVNAVNPGPVYSDFLDNLGVAEEYKKNWWSGMKKGTALDRISDASEIADVVLFLASEKARGITGSCYVSDNGALLKGSMSVE